MATVAYIIYTKHRQILEYNSVHIIVPSSCSSGLHKLCMFWPGFFFIIVIYCVTVHMETPTYVQLNSDDIQIMF